MRSRPSNTCKTLFDSAELPWFLHFSNTPVLICFYASKMLLSKEISWQISLEVNIANQHWTVCSQGQ